MQRRQFIKNGSIIAGALAFPTIAVAENEKYPVVRTIESKRKFKSQAVEKTIKRVVADIKNPKLAWLFENCYPNTLDTTVDYSIVYDKPDTYVITGDIDAMWLRDSTAQVYPYLNLVNEDVALDKLIQGVINRQVRCILLDPYANAFFKNGSDKSYWETDNTDMKPGVHERKWEIDSLCYPVLLINECFNDTLHGFLPFGVEYRS